MTALLPAYQDDLFSSILLGRQVSPGVVTLRGHDRYKNWQVQKAKGQQGATTKLGGDDPGEFEASFYLAQIDPTDPNGDVSRWEVFRRLIESTVNGPVPQALPIYHPDLAENGFTEVVSGGISQPLRDGRGGVTYVVKFVEYLPPKPKPPRKPEASVRMGVTTLEAPDPNAAAKAELAALVAQAQDPGT